MGCDIHLFTERYISHVKGEEKWVNIDHWTHNPWYKEGKDDERMLDHVSIYHGRDYELFGILADVRSTPDDGPISEPRRTIELSKRQVQKLIDELQIALENVV